MLSAAEMAHKVVIMVKFKEKEWHVFQSEKSSGLGMGPDLSDSISEAERKKAEKKARKAARKARKKKAEAERLAAEEGAQGGETSSGAQD